MQNSRLLTLRYNPKVIAKTLSLGFVHKQHLVTYNRQNGNWCFVHSPQQPTFKMTKYGLFYHDIMYLLKKKKNAHSMVNDSFSPIPQVEENKKQ